jgi:hypothetical protein
MNMNLRSFLTAVHFVFAIYMAAFALPAVTGPRDDVVASVTVYKEVLPQGVQYTYAVTNNGDRPITALSIGYEYYHGVSELVGDLPQQIESPSLWTGGVITLEASDQYEVNWRGRQAPILPGQTLGGFRVMMATADDRFVQSHWTVTVNGPPVAASGTLRQIVNPSGTDTIPPIVKVTLTPDALWPPNGKMVTVHATVTATDDVDGQLPARLVSVTCNECGTSDADIIGVTVGAGSQDFLLRAARTGKRKEGRVYTVTYSATDRAGNVGTGTATVRIPHDQKK